MELLSLLVILTPTLFRRLVKVQLENFALRRQLAAYRAASIRPKITDADRRFSVWLMRILPNWKSALYIVQPETVTRWQ